MPSQAAVSTGMGLVGFLPFLFIIVIFYFVLIRPQMKKEKELEKMRVNLKKGDNVVTAGGICGSVLDFRGDRVIIQADINTKLTVLRSSVSVVQTPPAPAGEPATKK